MLRDRMHLYLIEYAQGLDMTDLKMDKTTQFVDVENACPGLRFLDIQTDPVMQNTFTNDAAVDGSRFEYSTYQKSTVTLKFWLTFDNYEDFIEKKHDVERTFAQKAQLVIETSYRRNVMALCYFNSFENFEPANNAAHTCLFNVKLDNALGVWVSNLTSYMVEHWDHETPQDLRMPIRVGDPGWTLQPGDNRVYIPGDIPIKMTNPQVDCDIHMYGCGGDVRITNNTANNELYAHGDGVTGDLVWHGVDLRTADGIPINQYSTSSDFWLVPGWNDITLNGCSSAFIDTRFLFVNL